MTDPAVTLGTFAFQGLEVPDRVILRNKQRLSVHHLTSGVRAIESAGTDLQTITFRGIFNGQEASNRIKVLEEMREQGAPLLLSWDFQMTDVLIQDFELFYKSYHWVPYKLTLQVLDGNASADTVDAELPWPMSAARIADIVTLLGNTPLSMPPAVRSALLQLIGGNYDIASRAALTVISEFATNIDRAIESSTNANVDQRPSTDYPISIVTAGSQNGYRTQAYLRLSRNRIQDIAVRALEIGETG